MFFFKSMKFSYPSLNSLIIVGCEYDFWLLKSQVVITLNRKIAWRSVLRLFRESNFHLPCGSQSAHRTTRFWRHLFRDTLSVRCGCIRPIPAVATAKQHLAPDIPALRQGYANTSNRCLLFVVSRFGRNFRISTDGECALLISSRRK